MPIGFDLWRQGILAELKDEIGRQLAGISPARVLNVPLVLGTNGVPLAVGDHVHCFLGLNGGTRVLAWSIGATADNAPASGSVTIDILVGDTLSTAASICGATLPALASQIERTNQIPATDWTVHLTDAQWVWATVTATDGALQVVSVTLRVIHPDAEALGVVVVDGSAVPVVDGSAAPVVTNG